MMPENLSKDYLKRKIGPLKSRVVRHLLTSKYSSDRSPYFSKAIKLSTAGAKRRLTESNLVGIGIGVKEESGSFTGEVAIRLYVKRKKEKLPKKYEIPKSIEGIATDVIEVGTLVFHQSIFASGSPVRHVKGEDGSIGCILIDSVGLYYLLSASHVLAPAGAAIGDEVLLAQTSNGDISIAKLSDFQKLKSDGISNTIDAGIARVVRKSDVELLIPVIGKINPVLRQPFLYESVRKYGASTLHSLGIVTDVTSEARFIFGGEEFIFRDVIQVTGCGDVFSDGGDSGALVVDALTNHPVGTIIGGSGPRTFLTPIDKILNRFGVSFMK